MKTLIPLLKEEKQLKILMYISFWLYFLSGFVFLLFPEFVFNLINKIANIFRLKDIELSKEKFWLTLAFSMMMTISFLSLCTYFNPRKYRITTVGVIVSKFTSSIVSLILFLLTKVFAYLVILLTDGFLFTITFIFFIRAQKKFFIEQTHYLREKEEDFYKKYQVDKIATVACIKDDDKFKALDEALKLSNFFTNLEDKWKASNKSKEDFLITIKPNFMFLYSKEDKSTYTDPELVEYLINKIYEKGYKNIAIVEAQSTYGNYYNNREVLKVAEYIGYRTDKNYKIVDLTQEKVIYNYGGSLGKHYVGKTWKESDFRISFAKNKTHIFCYYTLTLKNIYGTLPMQDKLKEYHTKREYDTVTVDCLRHFPVDFGIIDAYISADGQVGVMTDRKPNLTKTIICGDDLIAVDYVGAKKMGLEPKVSRIFYLAVKNLGFPKRIDWLGDTSLYKPWENVNPVFIESLDLIEENYLFSNWFFSVITVMDDYFKFKRRTKVNLFLRKLLALFKRLFYKYGKL